MVCHHLARCVSHSGPHALSSPVSKTLLGLRGTSPLHAAADISTKPVSGANARNLFGRRPFGRTVTWPQTSLRRTWKHLFRAATAWSGTQRQIRRGECCSGCGALAPTDAATHVKRKEVSAERPQPSALPALQRGCRLGRRLGPPVAVRPP